MAFGGVSIYVISRVSAAYVVILTVYNTLSLPLNYGIGNDSVELKNTGEIRKTSFAPRKVAIRRIRRAPGAASSNYVFISG